MELTSYSSLEPFTTKDDSTIRELIHTPSARAATSAEECMRRTVPSAVLRPT